jgi:hypothetical protein
MADAAGLSQTQKLDINSTEPKSLVWSKTAEEILSSLERFRLKTSNSRH